LHCTGARDNKNLIPENICMWKQCQKLNRSMNCCHTLSIDYLQGKETNVSFCNLSELSFYLVYQWHCSWRVKLGLLLRNNIHIPTQNQNGHITLWLTGFV
jgi:hypothetical protein